MKNKQSHPDYPKLYLFKHPQGQSKNWYCGFYHKGKFVRISTGTDILKPQAFNFAEDWYLNNISDIKQGRFLPSGKKFRDLYTSTLSTMQRQGKSPLYIKRTKESFRKYYYIDSYFGDISVVNISTRTWDSFREWLFDKRTQEVENKEKHNLLSEKTIHQLKNTVRLVLREAYRQRYIEDIPTFLDIDKGKSTSTLPRTFFLPDEYEQLWRASRANIKFHKERKDRWISAAEELHDYIVFMANTGMRVSESQSIRFKDIRIMQDSIEFNSERETKEVCEISIQSGKRGARSTKSFIGAPAVFNRICKRRGISNPENSDSLLFECHHREAFKRLLREINLYNDKWGRKRDFVSLRHTYIVYRLMNGVPVYNVAKNVGTSVFMIEQHYAKSLDSLNLDVNKINGSLKRYH